MFDPIWLLRQPWFAISPSPFSFAFYLFCGLYGSWKLLRAGAQYKRFPQLLAFVDSLLILGLVIFIQDTLWLVFNTVKWIFPLYSDVATFQNYYIRYPQNLLGISMMLLLSYDRIKAGCFKFTKKTLLYFSIITGMLLIQFLIAPNQAWTDWMFAVSHGYSDWLILQGFILNVVMKILMFLAFRSFFHIRLQIEDSFIGLLKEENRKEEED